MSSTDVKTTREQLKKKGFQEALLPTSKDETAKNHNREAIREVTAELITASGYTAATSGGGYGRWYVKDERSLDEVVIEGAGYWRIELVSRVLNTKERWTNELHEVFGVLLTNFDIHLTKGCSMHVHVAPVPTWTGQSIRDFLKATGVYEMAIQHIMPPDRKHNPWARSNFQDGPLPKDKAKKELREAFERAKTEAWQHFFTYIDQIGSGNLFKQFALFTWGQERDVSWNLAPLDNCGTVEFRRPPGVKTASEVQNWAAFTLAFVSAATRPAWHAPWAARREHATVKDLRDFLSQGCTRLGWGDNVLNPANLKVHNEPAAPHTYFGDDLIKRKRDKAKKEGGIEEKIIKSRENSPANSRPSSSTSGSPGPAAAAGAAQSGTRVSGSSRPSSPAGGNRSSPATPPPAPPAGGVRTASPPANNAAGARTAATRAAQAGAAARQTTARRP
ncbi:hypothetical protein VTG60DRAFT_3567 [Thermothelomyces hinnuleus]